MTEMKREQLEFCLTNKCRIVKVERFVPTREIEVADRLMSAVGWCKLHASWGALRMEV